MCYPWVASIYKDTVAMVVTHYNDIALAMYGTMDLHRGRIMDLI